MTKQRVNPRALLALLDRAYDDATEQAWRSGLLEQMRNLLADTRTIGFYAYKSQAVEGGITLTIDGELTLTGDDAVETSLREL